MQFKILSRLGDGYHGEEGSEGERVGAFRMLEAVLARNLELAKALRVEATTQQVASNLPAMQSGRVKALVAFHGQQQTKHQRADRAAAEVIRIRQWLFRQGARVTPEGKVDWARSMATVVYDRDLARQRFTRVTGDAGRMFLNGKPFDTRKLVTMHSGPGWAIYVMSREGNVHVSSHSVGHRHHSSLLAGRSVAGAGELMVHDGWVKALSNKSGHYQPDVFQLLQVVHALFTMRVAVAGATYAVKDAHGFRQYPSIEPFLLENGFDDRTVEMQNLVVGYGHFLTPEWIARNNIIWVPAPPNKLVGTFCDATTGLPVDYAALTAKLRSEGKFPEYLRRSGGRH